MQGRWKLRAGDSTPRAKRSTSGAKLLRDVGVAEPLAHDAGVLALGEGVVVGMLVNSACSLASKRGDVLVDVLGAGAPLRDALSALMPRMANGSRASRPSTTGTRKRSEIAGTAPTYSNCVTSSSTSRLKIILQ